MNRLRSWLGMSARALRKFERRRMKCINYGSSRDRLRFPARFSGERLRPTSEPTIFITRAISFPWDDRFVVDDSVKGSLGG